MSRASRPPAPGPNGRRTPRSFCADCYPWPLIVDLSDGDSVSACYLVHEKQRGQTKQSKPFLRLRLGDRTGMIDAVVWDGAEQLDPVCLVDDIVGVRGRISTYREALQLTVEVLEPLDVEEGELEFFLPASPRDAAAMSRELDALLGTIGDPPLRTLLRRCLGKGTALGRAFRTHPAAKHHHHAYVGGLLEHSLSVAAICDALARHYQAHGLKIDRDLLVTGALLHDLGKVRELNGVRTFAYTTEGQLLGHIVLGIQIVAREAESVADLPPERLLLLQHLIASHQGRHEWASPQVPRMLEALILHYADDLDSKMNPAAAALSGTSPGGWSARVSNLDRTFLHPPAALPATGDIEPVPAEEAVELLIDLFRG